MKENKQKKVFLILSVLLVLTLTCPFAHATDVYVDPFTQTVGLGGTVSVDIGISDVNDLFGFEFATTYNPSILSLSSVTEGPFLGTLGTGTQFLPGDSSTPGQIGSGGIDTVYNFTKLLRAWLSVEGDENYNSEVDFDNDGVVGIVDFGLMPRTDDIYGTLYGNAPSGVNGSGTLVTLTFEAIGIGTSPISLYDVDLSDYYGSSISTSISSGSVTVTPEPISSILFLSGGATLGFRSYWRRRSKSEGC